MSVAGALLAELAAGIHPREPDPRRLLVAATAPGFAAALAEQKVAGIAARVLGEAGAMGELPEEARRALRAEVMRRQAERSALDQATVEASAALDGAGIPCVLLKGAALGAAVYAEPHLRPMSDVDLLVPGRRVGEALTALAAAGFRVPSAADTAFWKAAYYNLPFEWRGPTSIQLELHWSICQPDRHRPPLAALFERSRPLGEAHAGARILSPVDLLLHQALHHSYHWYQPKLIWIHDLALLHRDPPPLDELLPEARRWGMSVALALSCRQVEKVYPGALAADYRDWCLSHRRSGALVARFGSRHPLELLRGWQSRRRQLLLGLLQLDGGVQAARAVAAWAWRSLRWGDREGHRRLEGFRPPVR